MRIKVKDAKGKEVYGRLVGLTYDDKKTCLAVVRLNGDGLIHRLYHPSVVTPVDTPTPIKQIIQSPEVKEVAIPPAPPELSDDSQGEGEGEGDEQGATSENDTTTPAKPQIERPIN